MGCLWHPQIEITNIVKIIIFHNLTISSVTQSCPTLRPHELQHIRLPCPSLSPSEWSESHSLMSDSLQPHGLYSPWNSLGQNTQVGSHSILQGIFPTQGSNPGLPHCRQTLYQLSHKGSPRILEWVAYPFSRWSSLLKNRTGVSCTEGRFFTN